MFIVYSFALMQSLVCKNQIYLNKGQLPGGEVKKTYPAVINQNQHPISKNVLVGLR